MFLLLLTGIIYFVRQKQKGWTNKILLYLWLWLLISY